MLLAKPHVKADLARIVAARLLTAMGPTSVLQGCAMTHYWESES